MSQGLSLQQRAILDALPVAGDGTNPGIFGITIEEIAERLGRLTILSLTLDELRLRVQLGKGEPAPYLRATDRFTLWRALRSLGRRGLVTNGPSDTRRGETTRWRALPEPPPPPRPPLALQFGPQVVEPFLECRGPSSPAGC